MKRIFHFALVILMILASTLQNTIFVAAEGIEDFALGDINKDGKTDNLDAAKILKYDAGLIDLTAEELQLGDFNQSGGTENTDAAAILKYDAGINTTPLTPTPKPEPEPVPAPAPEPVYPSKKVFDVDYIGQEPNYPCGCEGVSAVMLLNYHGVNISVDDFFNCALDMHPFTYDWRTNSYYGEDMDRYYVGDPASQMGKGCFAPVIKTAIEKIVDKKYIAVVEQGGTVAELVDKYLKKMNRPILLWATSGMRDSFEGTTWKITRTSGTFTFPAYMHCMVLVGYDNAKHVYYFNDPWQNSGLVSYDKDLVEAKFRELGSQALALLTRDEYSGRTDTLDPEKTYAIRNAATGKYISILDGKTSNGTNVVQSTYTGAASQLFSLKKHSDGSYSFISKATGKAIDVMNINNLYAAGCNVHLYTYNGSKAQKFKLVEKKGFYNVLLSYNNNIAMAARSNYNGDSGKTGSSIGNVYMNTASESLNYYQLWEFVSIE